MNPIVVLLARSVACQQKATWGGRAPIWKE